MKWVEGEAIDYKEKSQEWNPDFGVPEEDNAKETKQEKLWNEEESENSIMS